ncbi:MAG TPA: TlpA disulfide reductase family protein [Bacteroidales bacterium]|nr:TlpA disulfide reductase family protein [Bacteroidales bacterium]
MLTIKKYFILIIPVLIITGCHDKNSFTIYGTAQKKTQDYIFLSRVNVNTTVPIDSSKIKKNGDFKFKVKAEEPDFYQISYTPGNFITLLAEPGEKIKLLLKNNILIDDYSVDGSPGSEQIRMLDSSLLQTKYLLDSLNKLYINISSNPGNEEKMTLLEQEYRKVMNEQRKFNISFILDNYRSLASIKALYQKLDDNTYVLNLTRDLQYMKIVSDTLSRYYPSSKHTRALMRDFNNEMSQLYTRQLIAASDTLPETKLDPDLVDINGKRIKLSSLRGKYVLLTFWSADSQECIEENLQLKRLYNTYKNRGFEIYQINLDTDEQKWKNAVSFDELPWISTREDDPSDPYNARLYNIKTLPSNFLYDREGNVIGTNLHGKNLDLKLDQLFN